MSAYVVGLTGGIASGKSAAGQRFIELGITVVDADVVAREIVSPGQPALAAIAAHFGPDILQADGTLDRARLRSVVFAEPAQRRALEAITHPAIRAQLQRQCLEAAGAYAVAAIPLLAEAGRAAYPWLQRVLLIDVPVEVQHARLMQRDGTDGALATRMIEAQASRAARLAIADDVIVNDGTPAALVAAVDALHVRYMALAGGSRSL